MVTRFVSTTKFDVAGYPITTNALAEFERGASTDLVINFQVKIKGTLNAAGVLVARKAEFTADESEAGSEVSWF